MSIIELIVSGVLLILYMVCFFLLVHFIKPSSKLKAFFGSLAVVAVIFGVIRYFITHQTELYGSFLYDVLQVWRTEAYALIIAVFLAILGLVMLLMIQGIMHLADRNADTSVGASRRELFKKAAVVIPTVTVLGSSAAAIDGQERIIVTRQHLTFPNTPIYLKGHKLAQISDIHIGPCIDLDEFDRIMTLVKAENPDRVVITGDLIDNIKWMPELCTRLNEWIPQFEHGITYILGNHEYIRDVDVILDGLRETKLDILINENMRLSNPLEPNEGLVYLVGVDYNMTRKKELRKGMLEQAMEGIPADAFTILLAHHPEFFEEAFARNIPLTLSGHTHGGQIQVMGMTPVPVGTPYVKGMYEQDGCLGYVNNGTGHWWPVRVNCPREISIFTFG